MKVINIVVGIGTAVILGSLIVLGIRAFHPEPPMPEYPSFSRPIPVISDCVAGDKTCIAERDAYNKEQQIIQQKYDQEYKVWNEAMKGYRRDVFLIANVIGIVVFILGFLIIFRTNVASIGVPIGVMLAGLWGIVYGYGRGWGSADDQLKFFVGLAVAVLVIGGSSWLMERYRRSHTA